MGVQIIHDDKGKATGVYIPMKEWTALKKQYQDLETLESEEQGKEQILKDIKDVIEELKEIEQGKLKARPAKDFLKEL